MSKSVYIVCLFITIQPAIIAQSGKFKLSGKINHQNLKYLILEYYSRNDITRKDTIPIKDNKFQFSGYLKSSSMAGLYGLDKNGNLSAKNFTQIFLEPCKMKLTVTEGQFDSLKLKGSKTHKMLDSLKFIQQPVQTMLEQAAINNSPTDVKDSLQNILNQIEIKFAASHPESLLAPYLIINHLSGISYADLSAIYNNYTDKVKSSHYGIFLKKEIEKEGRSEMGKVAPDFSAETVDGQAMQLSSFRNKKLVLLDFWASWCVPCRNEWPRIKRISEDTDLNKDLLIICISTDKKKNQWIKAITEDNITEWYHVLAPSEDTMDPHDIRNILSKYEARAIPVQYLIDKQGVIVGRWEGNTDENEKELKKKLFEISSTRH